MLLVPTTINWPIYLLSWKLNLAAGTLLIWKCLMCVIKYDLSWPNFKFAATLFDSINVIGINGFQVPIIGKDANANQTDVCMCHWLGIYVCFPIIDWLSVGTHPNGSGLRPTAAIILSYGTHTHTQKLA